MNLCCSLWNHGCNHFVRWFVPECLLWTSLHALAWSLQSCSILCDPTDCSPPGSSVHGILQARILEWGAMPSSRGSSQPRGRTWVSYISCIAGGFFTTEPPGEPGLVSILGAYIKSSVSISTLQDGHPVCLVQMRTLCLGEASTLHFVPACVWSCWIQNLQSSCPSRGTWPLLSQSSLCHLSAFPT